MIIDCASTTPRHPIPAQDLPYLTVRREMSEGARRTPTLALFNSRPSHHTYNKMSSFDILPPRTARRRKMSTLVILSYALDWLTMVVVGLIGYFLGNVTPNKRPFSLLDNNIAYVYGTRLQSRRVRGDPWTHSYTIHIHVHR